jgi:circadian clock protein KaiC
MQQPGYAVPPPGRVASGIQRLDYILKGGLRKGGTYNLLGPPGSGKTILGNQLCFHTAQQGGSCVYMSLLVESHAKMLNHMSSMAFFDEAYIPERIFYISGYQPLREGGPDKLLKIIRATLQERKPGVFVIDGMESLRHFANREQVVKEFVHELQAFTHMLGCTTLLMCFQDPSFSFTENAVVDGVIELSYTLIGPRAVRELTVHKFRGGDYLLGKHEVEIGQYGIIIHPRTEIQFDKPAPDVRGERPRLAFGVGDLDRMLHGGIPSGSCAALVGAPGTGKTLLGLAFLIEGARRGEKVTYFGFHEPPERLVEKMTNVGLDPRPFLADGRLEIIWQPPLEHMLDSLAEQLLENLRAATEPDQRRGRLFVDSMEGFRAAMVYPERMPRFLAALTNQFRMYNVTGLIAEELGLFQPSTNVYTPELVSVADTVIMLRYAEVRSQLYRLLAVMKMRESAYDSTIREFRITAEGLKVADSFASAEAILTGNLPHAVDGTRKESAS